ncbi:MAG: WG repeat-containing protein [Rubrivivax sp.]
MRSRVVSLLAALCCGAAAAAPTGPVVDLRQTWRLELAPKLEGGGWAALQLTLNARLWSLLGEPVVFCSATWKLGTVQMKTASGGGRVFDHVRSNTSATAWKRVALTQAKFAIPLERRVAPGRVDTAWVVCDIGAAMPESDPRPSFNVPGSPAWNRLLLRTAPGAEGPKALARPEAWMDAAEARSFVADAGTRWRDNSHQLEPIVLELDAGSLRALDELRLADEEARDLERRRQARRATPSDPMSTMFDEVDAEVLPRRQAALRERDAAAERQQDEAADARRRQLESKRCAAARELPLGGASFDAAAAAALALAERCGGSLDAFRDPAGKRWGYRSAAGETRVEPRWQAVLPFAEGRGGVYDGKVWRLVDRDGQIVGEGRWRALRRFAEGLAPANDGDRWGFVDTEGRWQLSPRYEDLEPLSDGLAPFRENGAWGYVDARGQVVVQPRYQSAGAFAGGRAEVRRLVSSSGRCDGYREDWELREIDRQGRELRVLRSWTERGQLCLSR